MQVTIMNIIMMTTMTMRMNTSIIIMTMTTRIMTIWQSSVSTPMYITRVGPSI